LPQISINVRVPLAAKKVYRDNRQVIKIIEEISAKYEGNGRVLIRPSGTEPMIRIMIEGPDEDKIGEDAQKIAEVMSRQLGQA